MSLYSSLTEEITRRAKDLDLQDADSGYPIEYLKSRVPGGKIEEELIKSVYILDNSNVKRKPKLTRKKKLSSKVKKELKIYDIKQDVGRYAVYLPLHELWLDYFREVMDLQHVILDGKDKTQIYSKLFKADYHGCIMTVTRSKCPSYIGLTGIVLQETRNVLKIITKEDKLKTIPKFNCVFTFEVDGFTFTIFGNHFRVKSSERAVKKFKAKATLNL